MLNCFACDSIALFRCLQFVAIFCNVNLSELIIASNMMSSAINSCSLSAIWSQCDTICHRREHDVWVCLSVCPSVCLSVCLQHNSQTKDPKVFKLVTHCDILQVAGYDLWVERSKVKIRVRVNSNTAWVRTLWVRSLVGVDNKRGENVDRTSINANSNGIN